MKSFTSKHNHTQNILKEHSPIYDMEAYRRKARRLRIQKVFKNTYEGGVFSLVVVLTFSILFLGY
ncbi:hypothetical protein F902_04104 [Acinetobacter higginsii]|uniref:Uncharacterized protein n=1 Tax=Acinetobacter higginsii TaxID=70347 RepID=N9SQ52_9GAMM|nr:hypothetical protein F902_04104 [Acinetobacter higginsii]